MEGANDLWQSWTEVWRPAGCAATSQGLTCASARDLCGLRQAALAPGSWHCAHRGGPAVPLLNTISWMAVPLRTTVIIMDQDKILSECTNCPNSLSLALQSQASLPVTAVASRQFSPLTEGNIYSHRA